MVCPFFKHYNTIRKRYTSVLTHEFRNKPVRGLMREMDKKTIQAHCLGGRLFVCVWGSESGYENLQLLAHSRLNLCGRQWDRCQMKQITEIQPHRSHRATVSEGGREDCRDKSRGEGSFGKINRIGDKTECRQRNRGRCGQIRGIEGTER